MKRTRIILIATLCSAVYVGGYVIARMTGSVVHYSGFATENGKRVVHEHSLRPGGGGSPIPRMLFAPLCWLEQGAWYVIEPKGSEWVEAKVDT